MKHKERIIHMPAIGIEVSLGHYVQAIKTAVVLSLFLKTDESI